MADSQSYIPVREGEILPNCPQCGTNYKVTLVDVIVDKTTGYGTNPCWLCIKCDKFFTGRGYGIQNQFNSAGLFQDYSDQGDNINFTVDHLKRDSDFVHSQIETLSTRISALETKKQSFIEEWSRKIEEFKIGGDK